MISLALFPILIIGLASSQPPKNWDEWRTESYPIEPHPAHYGQPTPYPQQEILYRQASPPKPQQEILYRQASPPKPQQEILYRQASPPKPQQEILYRQASPPKPQQEILYRQASPPKPQQEILYRQASPPKPQQEILYRQASPPKPQQEILYRQASPPKPQQEILYRQASPSKPQQEILYRQASPPKPQQEILYRQASPPKPQQEILYRQASPPKPQQEILYRQAPIEPLEKVKVELYYESQCPGCTIFFIRELEPTFADLGDYIDLDLIPFGNAKINSTGDVEQINCQHGPGECLLNRISACAFDMLTDMHAKVGIGSCLLQNSMTPMKDLPKCCRNVGLSDQKVLECANGPKGFQLHLANGEKTISERQRVMKTHTHEFWTPWVTINNNWQTYVYGTRTLRDHVCDILQGQGITPDGCPQP